MNMITQKSQPENFHLLGIWSQRIVSVWLRVQWSLQFCSRVYSVLREACFTRPFLGSYSQVLLFCSRC